MSDLEVFDLQKIRRLGVKSQFSRQLWACADEENLYFVSFLKLF